jgi:hypothetical protein
MQAKTAEWREKAAENICSQYLNSGIRTLLKDPDHPEVKHTLKKLVIEAASRAYSLWTQKIYLVTKSINDQEVGEVFQHKNPLLEGHRFHSGILDGNPARLDGIPILVITHPALVQHGNEYGREFGTRTVLKKAVCWMGRLPEGAA